MPSPISRRRLVSSSSFNPSLYGGGSLKVWLKADSLSLADGASVSTWLDSSKNGNNATAGTAPTFKTGIQNGRPGILFAAASNQHLIADGLSAVANGTDLPYTLFIACDFDDPATNRTIYSWGNSGTNTQYDEMIDTSGNSLFIQRVSDAGTTKTITPGVNAANLLPAVYAVRFDGTNVTIWRNGGSSIGTGAYNSGALTIDRFTLGMFRRATNANAYNGYIFEVIIYNSSLTDSEKTTIERALGTKWGIAVS